MLRTYTTASAHDNTTTTQQQKQPPVDLIVAADVVWLDELVAPLATYLRAVLDRPGSRHAGTYVFLSLFCAWRVPRSDGLTD